MTSSLLLTALLPTTDADPFSGDRTKPNVTLPPFGVTPISQASSESSKKRDAYNDADADTSIRTTRTVIDGANHAHSTLVACQWTGMPMRAIVPLPRRKLELGPVANGSPDTAPSRLGGGGVHSNALSSTVSCLKRSTHGWDDVDANTDTDTDSGRAKNGDEDGEGEESDEDSDDVMAVSQHCSYESITAAEGLSAWSFEELRVECYAQSLVARGTKPPPVFHPALAIPPAFVPRSVARNQTHYSLPTVV